MNRNSRERLGTQWKDVLDQLEVAELPQEDEAEKEIWGDTKGPPYALVGRALETRAPELQKAKGRISIKIDLPFDREMQVYHFAKLAPEGSVTVEATEGESKFLQELATFVCFGAACAFVFLRRK